MNANSSPSSFAKSIVASWSRGLAAVALIGVLSISTSAMAGSLKHEFFMQGQVLEVKDKTVTICIGSRDGAEVGQVLQVIRHEPGPYSPKRTIPNFTRKNIGSVRIATIFDDHYSVAEIIGGELKVNDTVELDKP